MSDKITPCARCGHERQSGYRYCRVCIEALKAEMKQSGYLQKYPKETEVPEDEEDDEVDLDNSIYSNALRLLEDER